MEKSGESGAFWGKSSQKGGKSSAKKGAIFTMNFAEFHGFQRAEENDFFICAPAPKARKRLRRGKIYHEDIEDQEVKRNGGKGFVFC